MTVTGITDVSDNLYRVYLLRINEYYGVGKPKGVTDVDRARILLKRHEQILEVLDDVDLVYPNKITVTEI